MRGICPDCGEVASDPRAKFCEGCGKPFHGAVAETSDPVPPAPPSWCGCSAPAPGVDGYCGNCGRRSAAQQQEPPRGPEYESSVDESLAVASDRGMRHPTNQDAGAVGSRADGAILLVVADGVSSAPRSEEASERAVAAAVAAFDSLNGSAESLAGQARAAVVAAAKAVEDMALPGEVDGPAATMVAIVAAPTAGGTLAFGVAWVGDSRAYIVASSVPEALLTRDDSWCMDQADSGRMTYAAAVADQNAHAITQWLGMGSGMVVHVRQSAAAVGSSLLLCSDGLWNYADRPGAMAKAFTEAARNADAATIARRLVEFANGCGGHDNVTVAIKVI